MSEIDQKKINFLRSKLPSESSAQQIIKLDISSTKGILQQLLESPSLESETAGEKGKRKSRDNLESTEPRKK